MGDSMKYPTGINKQFKQALNHSNRGMPLENDINTTNEYYLFNNIAVIYKKPTPITIVKVDYASNHETTIKEAYFTKPSTTDYNGIYNGWYIDFEAKETKNKTMFPIDNIHTHQIKHLSDIIDQGGIGFIIVRFTTLNLTYYLNGSKLLEFIKVENRKSIPIDYFKSNGHIIKDGLNPRLDYIKIINEFYIKGEKRRKV